MFSNWNKQQPTKAFSRNEHKMAPWRPNFRENVQGHSSTSTGSQAKPKKVVHSGEQDQRQNHHVSSLYFH